MVSYRVPDRRLLYRKHGFWGEKTLLAVCGICTSLKPGLEDISILPHPLVQIAVAMVANYFHFLGVFKYVLKTATSTIFEATQITFYI